MSRHVYENELDDDDNFFVCVATRCLWLRLTCFTLVTLRGALNISKLRKAQQPSVESTRRSQHRKTLCTTRWSSLLLFGGTNLFMECVTHFSILNSTRTQNRVDKRSNLDHVKFELEIWITPMTMSLTAQKFWPVWSSRSIEIDFPHC